ncbi:hypothetical protein H2200_011308 [Cladophialophora chaetospira]|uniref:Uncharacterized protein n=1 Tax=Cladophialophora chaetospira TaxID=386627 RepID=A0AA38X0I1_9EURO|nr:hypothetical protein H2200_011308 [Cladophialophora chaetospira]
MDPKEGLLYVTLDSGHSENVSPVDILDWVKERSGTNQIPEVEGAYIYRATGIAEPTPEKPEWLVMWEFENADTSTTNSLATIEMPNPGKVYRRDLFSLQSRYTAASFSRADLLKSRATNFIVAVIIVLNEELKAEYDKYYEEEHIGALRKVPGWRRTRRFVEIREDGNKRTRQGEVQILQLHDYDPGNYGVGGQEFKEATSTSWYRKMMANAVKTKDRRTYELYGTAGF